MLIHLGGRYGSIEPKSQKSYIHLEYEYAVEQGKPLFAVVIANDHIDERVKKFGTKVIETDHSQKLKDFRTLVLTKMSKFWHDPRDIKLAVLETMSELSRRSELVGWIPGSEAVNGGALAEEIARLTKENAALREQLAKSSSAPTKYNGLSFEEMYSLLAKAKIDSPLFPGINETLIDIAKSFGDAEPVALHLFWWLSGELRSNRSFSQGSREVWLIIELEKFGLVELDSAVSQGNTKYYKLTECGKQFFLRLRLQRANEEAEEYISKDL